MSKSVSTNELHINDKLEKRRNKNALYARRSRARKAAHKNAVKLEYQRLTAENTALRYEISRLRQLKSDLEQLNNSHVCVVSV